jgi:hypothetical protein
MILHLAGHAAFADLEHIGRRSGEVRHTPERAFRTGDRVPPSRASNVPCCSDSLSDTLSIAMRVYSPEAAVNRPSRTRSGGWSVRPVGRTSPRHRSDIERARRTPDALRTVTLSSSSQGLGPPPMSCSVVSAEVGPARLPFVPSRPAGV